MRSMAVCITLFLALLSAIDSRADIRPRRTLPGGGIITGGNLEAAKAGRDTVILMGGWGSGATYNGQFQDESGAPAWNGWTHVDLTQPIEHHWQLSDYFAGNLPGGAGNIAAWCGDIGIAACTEDDPEGGYGNSWNEILEWRAAVDNPTLGVNVHLSAVANIDSEPGYDGTEIVYFDQNGRVSAAYYDGYLPAEIIDVSFSLTPDDYQGPGSDEVVIHVQFQSDGGWSDADCLWPTAGALQIDDIGVILDQGGAEVDSYSDFETGWGDWSPVIPEGVGDFAQLWTALNDLDPCVVNNTPQVAFIDDGEVVEGVGPTYCIDWCYGPGGYIVNTTGGLVGPDGHIHNAVESPVMPWPAAGMDGATLEFTSYVHEDLSSDSPGIFYTWGVRSTASGDPADIQSAAWADRNFVIFGGPWYARNNQQVSDLMVQDRQYVQIQLAVYELGFVWGFVGNDGYPAPYFDNVRFTCYDRIGPAMSAREIDLAQDNFPDIGEVDLANLENNSVRFDMANTSSLQADLVNIPGDSIVVDIAPVRSGSELLGMPELHWRLQRNPLFDPYRTSVYGAASGGVSVGFPAANAAGPVAGKYAFDLPDSNFLFPGDVLHYFIVAQDDDGVQVQSAMMPADTTGFSDFTGPLSYHSSFTVRALPSVHEDLLNPGQLTTPATLFWNDNGGRLGQNEWHLALTNLGFRAGYDYDTYYTNGPSSGVGNGLGGRATHLSLIGYENMLYTAGSLGTNTLANGDFGNDPSNDLEILDSWLRLGEKDIFLTGDGVVSDLVINAGASGVQFVDDWMKVQLVSTDVRPLLNNQATPYVRSVTGNGVFLDDQTWIAYGGCPAINTFDAVAAVTAEGAVQLAEFLDDNGAPGAYPYSAGTLYVDVDSGSQVVTLPYDFMYIYTDPAAGKVTASLPTRALLLDQVLAMFGVEGRPLDVTPVPEAGRFALRSYPNPFNPAVRIDYSLPRAGHLTVKVFDIKGQLVKTLVDQRLESSGHVMWDGTDERGARVGSGIYFAEARTAGRVQVQKMALVK